MPRAYTTKRPKVTWNCISDPSAPLYLVSAVSDTYVGAKRVKAPPEKPAKVCLLVKFWKFVYIKMRTNLSIFSLHKTVQGLLLAEV